MKTNTTITNLSTTSVKAILALADEKANMSAERYHELWELAKRELTREEQATVWSELSSRSIERKLGHFAGRKYRAAHPEAEVAAPAKPEKKAKKAPAKQEKAAAPAKPEKKAKAEKAPAKQEKAPAKPKAPTQKEVLANILTTLVSMDKRLTAIEKKLA